MKEVKTKIPMSGVTEYSEGMEVCIARTEGDEHGRGQGRYIILAKNEGGYNCTQVDLEQCLRWIYNDAPEIYMSIIPEEKEEK